MGTVLTQMRASSTNILIISDVQAGLAYENILRRNSFSNISTCRDSVSALQIMENNPPQVILTDTTMIDIDGFELASDIREIERSENRFTYIMMVADDTIQNKTDYSTQANVDAIISPEAVPFRLIPQMMSGERIAMQTNNLLMNNSTLQDLCESFESGQLLAVGG